MDKSDLIERINQTGDKDTIRVIEELNVLKLVVHEADSKQIPNIIDRIRGKVDSNIRVYFKSKIHLSTANPGRNYSNCVFCEEVDFSGSYYDFDANFSDCIFMKRVSFRRLKFKKNVRFHRTKFLDYADFTNTTFKQLCDFYYAEFSEDQQFHLTDFEGKTIFSNAIFNKSAQFLHNKIASETFVSFESTQFKNGLDLSRANFWCDIQFWGINFDPIDFDSFREGELYQTDGIDDPDKADSKSSLQKIRETFRTIKQTFRSQGNIIESQKYHRLEMYTFQEEVKIGSASFNDRFILVVNKYSNDYGLDWIKGLKFTLKATGVFYIIYLASISHKLTWNISWTGFGETISYFFQLLNPAFWDYSPFGVYNPFGYIILFVARVFIGYGYYQTIQAFRKFGKN